MKIKGKNHGKNKEKQGKTKEKHGEIKERIALLDLQALDHPWLLHHRPAAANCTINDRSSIENRHFQGQFSNLSACSIEH